MAPNLWAENPEIFVRNCVIRVNNTLNFEEKLRESRKFWKCASMPFFFNPKDTNKSTSNLVARDDSVLKTLLPTLLNMKKTKQKKHIASKISSSKTITSIKQRNENKRVEIMKTKSSIINVLNPTITGENNEIPRKDYGLIRTTKK